MATLNELRVRSLWAEGGRVDSRSHADQKKSFTRTLLEHGEPFDVLDLSKTYQGIPDILTAGVFARWAIWDFIERGFLTDQPAHHSIRLYMGYDACTGVLHHSNSELSVIGTTCYLRKLWIVSNDLTDEKFLAMSNVPCKLYGCVKGENFQQIDGAKPLWKLQRLPSLLALGKGKFLSMAKISHRF